MNPRQIQELCEGVIIATLNGGELHGFVFRHDDTEQKAKADMASVKASAPVPQLDGPRGYLVEVTVEIKSATAKRNAALHGEAMQRLSSAAIIRAAALSAGMTEADDLYIMDEDIGGDRSETKNLRKRSITIPMRIRPNV